MLQSMTGFGSAVVDRENYRLSLEIRSVNHRHLKITHKLPDELQPQSRLVEARIREAVQRGTVTVVATVERQQTSSPATINSELLADYARQIEGLRSTLPTEMPPLEWSGLLGLPGVFVRDTDSAETVAVDDESLVEVLEGALTQLAAHRESEGGRMADDVRLQIGILEDRLAEVERLAPAVVARYRERLEERLREWFARQGATLDPRDTVREVALFADKSDINEEILRLRSHLTQFDELLGESESEGKRLDFTSQELFREVNTIGSKANEPEITRLVVDMKAALEKIREVLANVE